MKNTKKSFYNLFFSLGSQIIIVFLGLFIPQYILRFLGSEVNGLVNSITQILAYFSLFEAGIQATALQSLYKSVKCDSRDEINAILSAVNLNYKRIGFIYLIMLIILAITYPFFLKNTTITSTTIFLIVIFLGLGNVFLFWTQGKYNVLLRASGENYVITKVNTVISIIISLTKIILLNLGCNIVIVLGISFLISLSQYVYLMCYMKKKYSWIDLTVKPNNKAISQKNFALVHQFSTLVFMNTDVILLTFFCDLKTVSVYSIYKLIVGQLSALLQIPFNSCSFALGQIFQTDIKRFKKIINAIDVYNCGLVFSILSVAYFLLTPFITLYTKNITDAVYIDKYLPALFIAIEILSCMRLPMLNTINYAGHFKNTVPQSIIETVINLVVSIVAVYYLGIYGVLLGTIVALTYRGFDFTIYSNIKILKRSPLKTFMIYFVNIILFFVSQFICSLISIQITSYFMFIIVGLIITPITLTVFMTFLSLIFRKEFKYMFSIAKPLINRYVNRIIKK